VGLKSQYSATLAKAESLYRSLSSQSGDWRQVKNTSSNGNQNVSDVNRNAPRIFKKSMEDNQLGAFRIIFEVPIQPSENEIGPSCSHISPQNLCTFLQNMQTRKYCMYMYWMDILRFL